MSSKTEKQRQSISDKIKQMRIDAGYTSYENFALEKSIDRKQYWRIEENKANITLDTLLKILEFHNIALEDFFKGL